MDRSKNRNRPLMGNFAFAIALVAVFFTEITATAQTNSLDCSSREVSIFNPGAPYTNLDVSSRELSVYNGGQASTNSDVISLEVSIFNGGQVSTNLDATSLEIAVFNLGATVTNLDATSLEVSFYNSGQTSTNLDATSREVSIFELSPADILDVASREVSSYNYGEGTNILSIGSTNLLIGSTNGFIGGSASVPLTLQSVAYITNLNVTIKTDGSRLQISNVTIIAPEVVSVSLPPANSNGQPVSFTMNYRPPTLSNRVIATVTFGGLGNGHSAVIPVNLTNLYGYNSYGQSTPTNIARNGKILLIEKESFLTYQFANSQFGVNLFGLPGATYSLQSTTNLSFAVWHELWRSQLAGEFVSLPGFSNSPPQQFLRAVQVAP